MWLYYERYHDANYAEAALDHLRSLDPYDYNQAFEPISIPAILNWLAIVSVALCVIVIAINSLS
jgi:hypothetical protein